MAYICFKMLIHYVCWNINVKCFHSAKLNFKLQYSQQCFAALVMCLTHTWQIEPIVTKGHQHFTYFNTSYLQVKKGGSEPSASDQVPAPAPSPSPSATSNDDKTPTEEKTETPPVRVLIELASPYYRVRTALKYIGLVAVNVVLSYKVI